MLSERQLCEHTRTEISFTINKDENRRDKSVMLEGENSYTRVKRSNPRNLHLPDIRYAKQQKTSGIGKNTIGKRFRIKDERNIPKAGA